MKRALDRAMLELLERARAADPQALTALLTYRVPCNEQLADDPDVQVLEDEFGTVVGVLGLLNGILGAGRDGKGRLLAHPGPDGVIARFEITG